MVHLGEAWLEITVLPFLGVLSAFLAGRLATSSEVNRRFLALVLSTLVAAAYEACIELFDVINTPFYLLLNLNAYCLLAYVAAYTKSDSRTFIDANFFGLCVALVSSLLWPNAGGAILFVTEAFVVQLLHQKFYGNGQFIVMNLLFILLIDAFLVQYVFFVNVTLVYSVATLLIVFTFFYLEAPTYRRLITAREAIDAERVRAEESIKRVTVANKAKSNFLASTSHEVRTPMNAILGINDLILDEQPEPEAREAALNIKKAGEYLLTLVNNILDISKIEAGKMELFLADYYLVELLRDCESYVTSLLDGRKNVKFYVSADSSLPKVLHGDALRLRQALFNLLSNAVKYTRTGRITLDVKGTQSVGARNVELRFAVKDSGVGMRDVASIFEPFQRVDVADSRHIMGAGLGLTLVKGIMDIMGGQIHVESSYGMGSTFTLTVTQGVGVVRDVKVRDAKAVRNIKELRVLVVDDTPVNLVVAKGMLQHSVAAVDTAESGEQALELLRRKHYDVAFLDHLMPGMDGVETLRHAKKLSPYTKFIALTANSGVNAHNIYIAHGFDDFLPKPFKKVELLDALR